MLCWSTKSADHSFIIDGLDNKYSLKDDRNVLEANVMVNQNMNDNTFAADFIFGFVTKHRYVSVMFSDSYLPRGAVSWWIFYASVDHHVK